jgi:acetyl esterase/lipase
LVVVPVVDPNVGMSIRTDVQYAAPGGVPLTGTLYRPVGQEKVPVVIAVHGGGWKQGSPQRYEHWGPWFTQRGMALFTIKYRLADRPGQRFPAPALDVVAAIHFIRAAAAELDLDGQRVALMGDSAGAHLVSLVALAGEAPITSPGSGGQSVNTACTLPQFEAVRAVIAIYGVYDLVQQWEHDQIARPRDHVTEALMGFSPLEDRLAYLHASPMSHATTRAPRSGFLVAWGTDDDVVDWAPQSGRFVTALKQSGQFVRTVAVVGAPHFWIDQPIDEPGSFTAVLAPKLERFLADRF